MCVYICVYVCVVSANGLGDQVSIPGRVIIKTQKMALDATLLNTQHYKVRIEVKKEQSKEWSSTLSYRLPLYCHYCQVHSGPDW